MPSFKVAHIRQQSVDLIIVPMSSAFGSISDSDQEAQIQEMETRAHSAGLAGGVVPVWDSGGGRMKFRAPQQWHPFFRSISLSFVRRNINKEISW
jgi:hypothetical protein